MNCIKKSLICVAAATSAMFVAATPEVSNVTMTQSAGSRLVTITYSLTEDAVVTLDVLTNATPNAATGWASIGGKAICNAQGAVWRKVTSADADGSGNYTITWRPDNSWTDEFGNGFKIADGCAKAVVTAYALDNTPDYMVVDISSAAQPGTQRYYSSTNFLPGGLFGNPDYRTTSIVMRKIMAKDVEWTMGSTLNEQDFSRDATREDSHKVTLTNNYYIGVFEVTQTQWALVQTNNPSPSFFSNRIDRAMRPVENLAYNLLRPSGNTAAYSWPAAPEPSGFLGMLRARTGIDFDLPSEAQWEFACRAGNGDTKWNDGSAILSATEDGNLNRLGRYFRNSGKKNTSQANALCGATNGTAIVGSYAPNSWGLYDMHGNVVEICLDWFEDNIGSYGGKVNINPADPTKLFSGNSNSSNYRVARGGSWDREAGMVRSAFRFKSSARNNQTGCRLACTAGLQ